MKLSGTNLSATGHKGGLGDVLYDRAGARPSLDLNFAKTKSLTDNISKENLITFTRSVGGAKASTYVDENGLIKRATQNLLKYSHDIGNSSGWGALGQTTTAVSNTTETLAPDGTQTATKCTFNLPQQTADSQGNPPIQTLSSVQQGGTSLGALVGDTIIWSLYLKSATGSNQTLNMSCSGTGLTVITVTNEWQRFEIRATRTDTNYACRFGLRAGNGPNFVITATNGIYPAATRSVYAWGGQAEKSDNTGNNGFVTGLATELIKTTTQGLGAPRFTHDPVTKESRGLLIEQGATNLISNKDATSSQWSKTDLNISSTLGTAPTGVNEAYELIAAATTGSHHMNDTVNSSNIDSLKYTFSVFLKKGAVVNSNDVSKARIKIGQSGEKAKAEIDLTNGTINVSTGTGYIENYGNDWYRATIITNVALSSSSGGCTVFVNVLNTNGSASFTGAGESIFFYGPQLEAGEAATSYIPTSGQADGVTRSAEITSIVGDNFGTYTDNLVTNTSFRKLYDGWLDSNNTILEPYAAASPFGTYDAGKLIATGTGSSQHQFRQNLTLEPSVKYNASVYVKAGNWKIGRLGMTWNDGTTPTETNNPNTFNVVSFNLNEGYVDSQNRPNQGFTTGSITTSSVTPVGNGWFRVQMVSATTASTIASANVAVSFLDSEGEANFTANDENFFIWGVQVAKADTNSEFMPSIDNYTNRQSNAKFVDNNGVIKFSYANLLKYSQRLTHGDWSKQSNVSFTANDVVDPDGSRTADTPNFDSAKWGFFNSTTNPGNWMPGYSQGTEYPFLNSLTSEWVRYNVSITTESGQTSMRVYPLRRADGMRYIYQTVAVEENTAYVFSAWYKKVGTKVYVWGCQLVKGSEAGDYYLTTDTISGPPRYSHDPETLTSTGLYLEPAATNLFPYSQDFSQSEWTKDNISLDSNTTATTAPDGTNTATLITATGNANHRIRDNFSLGTHQYTLSVFVKANTSNRIYLSISKSGNIGGQLQKVFKLDTEEVDTSAQAFGNTGTGKITKYPNNWYRIEGTSTESTATGNASVIIALLDDDGDYGFTASGESAYFWGAQLEQGAGSTSYITSTGQTNGATRSADIFDSIGGSRLTRSNGKQAFYSTDVISYFVAWQNIPNTTGGNLNIFNNEGGSFFRNGSNSVGYFAQYDGSIQSIYFLTANDNAAADNVANKAIYTFSTKDDPHKAAFRFKHNDFIIYADGFAGTPDFTTPTRKKADTMFIGGNNSGASSLNGAVSRIAIWKKGLTNNTLNKITS